MLFSKPAYVYETMSVLFDFNMKELGNSLKEFQTLKHLTYHFATNLNLAHRASPLQVLFVFLIAYL